MAGGGEGEGVALTPDPYQAGRPSQPGGVGGGGGEEVLSLQHLVRSNLTKETGRDQGEMSVSRELLKISSISIPATLK